MPKVDTTRPTLMDACFASKVRTLETGIAHFPQYVDRKGWSAVPMIRQMIGADIGIATQPND